jgi:hypothetical protein
VSEVARNIVVYLVKVQMRKFRAVEELQPSHNPIRHEEAEKGKEHSCADTDD